MQGYWRNFAASGNPNGMSLPAWPSYEPVADRHLRLKAPIAVGRGLAQNDCDFWDALAGA